MAVRAELGCDRLEAGLFRSLHRMIGSAKPLPRRVLRWWFLFFIEKVDLLSTVYRTTNKCQQIYIKIQIMFL